MTNTNVRSAIRIAYTTCYGICWTTMWLGRIVNVGLGLWLWWLWLDGLMDWLGGFLGSTVGIILAPGALIYPLVHWLVEDEWPIRYLWVYGSLVVSVIITSLASLAADD